MPAVLTGLLALLTSIAGSTAEVSTIGNIIETLVGLIPTLVQTFKDAVPAVKGIIAALSANPAATADQLVTLKALDEVCDQAFEAAATAADAQDNPQT